MPSWCNAACFYANITMDVFAIANVTTMRRHMFCAIILMNAFGIMNVTTTQHRMYYAIIPMNVFYNINILMMQHRMYCAIIPMNAFGYRNVLMVQRRRCCSFDSPGLARNEPTPGQRLQGDSTLYALRLLGENIVFVSSCVSILGPTP